MRVDFFDLSGAPPLKWSLSHVNGGSVPHSGHPTCQNAAQDMNDRFDGPHRSIAANAQTAGMGRECRCAFIPQVNML